MYIDFYILNPVKEIRFRDYDIAKFLIIYNKKKSLDSPIKFRHIKSNSGTGREPVTCSDTQDAWPL